MMNALRGRLNCLLALLLLGLCACTTQQKLMYAARHGNLDAAEQAMLHGASATAADRAGNTPLHALATRDLSSLIFTGSDGDWLKPSTYTKFGHAADDLLLFDLLLRNGADVNARNKQGLTPLHVAAQNNSPHIALLLIARGADPMARDKIGRTPLELAARAGYRDFLEVLRRERRRAPGLAADDVDRYLNHWQDYAPQPSAPHPPETTPPPHEGSEY